MTDILDVQLEIAKKVVAQIGSSDAPLFNAAVQAAIRRKAPETLESYDCVLLTYWFYETFAPERQRRPHPMQAGRKDCPHRPYHPVPAPRRVGRPHHPKRPAGRRPCGRYPPGRVRIWASRVCRSR